MVELARARAKRLGHDCTARVRFHVGDVRNLQRPAHQYDLIVTHFFLDCFADHDLLPLVRDLAGYAGPRARWILSEFCEAPGRWGRLWTGAVTRSLYAAFKLTTNLTVTRLPDYGGALEQAGFQPDKREEALGGLLHSSVWVRAGEPLVTG